ncbi:hypothetical protein QUB68_28560 [Microcoleus sp. A006_D1]|uniref:hypothetical protein n=1 Tax=Microcoleus sp. A006_D1 TaxID=3055267 RepID=UPI002FD2432F
MNPVLAARNANIIKMPSAALAETFARSPAKRTIEQFEAKQLPSTTFKPATKYNKI